MDARLHLAPVWTQRPGLGSRFHVDINHHHPVFTSCTKFPCCCVRFVAGDSDARADNKYLIMAAKLLHVVAATCLLFVVHSQGRVDLAALRHEDIWPPESSVTGTGLTVDLGYGLYQGYNNATSGLNIWKGYAPLQFHRDPYIELTLAGSASLRLPLGTSVGRRPEFRRRTGL